MTQYLVKANELQWIEVLIDADSEEEAVEMVMNGEYSPAQVIVHCDEPEIYEINPAP